MIPIIVTRVLLLFSFKYLIVNEVYKFIYITSSLFIIPSSIVMTLSAWSAMFVSWVITIKVCLYFFTEILRSSTTSFEFLLSRLPVGSSAKTIVGLFIKALPIEVLCCCPPLSWFGRWFSLSFKPRVFIKSS